MAMLSSLDVTSIKTFWQKLSGKGLFIAVLDFFFLSLAVYTGYTIRLGVVMPRYIGDWLSACLVLPAVCVTFFTIFGQ
ncbi:MAG: hypothetical protein IJQ74_00400 [Synergistaceae bacterium]|nr:hypothetical protein [Synergistaceae bacterium]